MIKAHADIVGSLLRPPELIEALQLRSKAAISPSDFKRVEDAAVDAALQLQEEAGLEVLTDGEMRRLSFQSQVCESYSGFSEWDIDAFLWGDWQSDDLGEKSIERPPIAVLEPLRRQRSLGKEEFTYAQSNTDRTIKFTIPSPSLFANFWDTERSVEAYRNAEEYLTAVAELLKEDVDELVALGCTYFQIDAPHYTLLLDPKFREFYEQRGNSADHWLDFGLALDNLVIGNRPGVTFAFHLCRGNQGSRWLVEGGYDQIASQIFTGIKANRLMLEYDDARSGTFEPLAQIPDDKIAVLGLVTTKSSKQENVDSLRARILEASQYCPLERLAISPQCGFATSIEGNDLEIDDQKAKLRTLVETASEVWG
ncbi:MAG: cobalamin-independent methionine synthase II family protein [Pseudomonadota bacterium]